GPAQLRGSSGRISLGVPAGARSPNQVFASKPGTVSLAAARSGNCGTRSRESTEMALSCPDLTYCSHNGNEPNTRSTCPPITPFVSGPPPLYCTTVIRTPAIWLNRSPDRWPELPAPAEP